MDKNIGLGLRGITLQEALDIVYDSDNEGEVTDFYIEPPESEVLTDGDSADEDEGGFVDNLSKRQLEAGVEIRFSNNKRLGGPEDVPRSTELAEEINISPERAISTNNRNVNFNLEAETSTFEFYKNADLEFSNPPFPVGNYSQYSDMDPVQLFECFFSDELLLNIKNDTTKYALFQNCSDPQVSLDELRVFLGILLLSGYNELPSKRSYWETSADMRNNLVFESMRRDRFLQICRFIHFADNNDIDKADKMYKLRSLTDFLKEKFLLHFVPERNLSYDESMIRYYGRHGCKQFIRGKPIRFGYKVWSLNTPAGYMINFEVYQGRNPRANIQYEQLFGKCAAPLVQMINDLDEDKRTLRYNLFFDNLFTGKNLLRALKNNGYGATGTVRENRMPKECPLQSKKEISKEKRGTYSSVLEAQSGIQFIRWKDNNVVTIASTSYGIGPLRNVDRYSRQEKKIVSVPRPYAFSEYNKNMGGTDLMDQNISNYRVGIRAKKWYWPIFTYFLVAAVQNAWIIYRKTGRNISQLEFRRAIVQSYLTRFKNPPSQGGRPTTPVGERLRVAANIRQDRLDHYVIPVPEGKRKRCAAANCSGKGRTMCCKCQVGLCISCFKDFHCK